MKAVLLAGGKGTRLRPYTTNFPKPLMPIGDKPILEIVISQLRDSGIKEIIIATGHLEELIRVFFGDGSKFGVSITYTKEDTPLGTAGPLNMVKERLDETFILMNGDVLANVDYKKLLNFHKNNGNYATITLSKRTVYIDYGVVEIDEKNQFTTWSEKPEINYLVSTGIYMFEPAALKYLPEKRDSFITAPDLIQAVKGGGNNVGGYLHDDYWLDIGRPEDYEKACNDFMDKF